MNRYDALLEKLRPLLAPSRPEDVVRRVDASRDGSLLVQTDLGDRRRWFEVRGHQVRSLDLEEEEKLPLLTNEAFRERKFDPTPLAWYPGRRVVLTANDQGRPTVLKGYRKHRSEIAAARHGLAILATAGSPVRVPSLVAVHAKAEAIEFERVRGRTLLAEACDPGDLFRIGLGLRHMQAQQKAHFVLPLHDAAAELEVLDVLAGRVAKTTDRLPPGWRDVRTALGEWAPGLPSVTPCLAHRDLHDRQILVAGEHLWLIDFDLLCWADPLLDVANLSAHILLRSLQSDDHSQISQSEAACTALLDGLDRYQDPHFWARLRYFQSTTFLRLAAVYSMRPRWMQRTEPLVHYAERCLEERAHV